MEKATVTATHHDVVAAVVCHEGMYLCMRRGQTRYAYTSHKYEFPGGKVEAGETPQQALRRELMEEMDYDVQVGPLVATVHHRYPDFSITLRAYLCTAATTHFCRKEHENHRWLPPQRLMELDWAAADQPVVELIGKTARPSEENDSDNKNNL